MDTNIGPDEMLIHMGPHHIAQPGPFRLNVKLKGETVQDSDVEMGFIHKGIEKILESKTYLQGIPVVDRACYLAALTNEEAFVGCVEKLAGIEPTERSQYIRVIVEELSRIQSHLLGYGEYTEFIGFMTMFFYPMTVREKILDLLEMTTGARITHSYLRFGGVRDDLPEGFEAKCKEAFALLRRGLEEWGELMKSDTIYRERTVGVGVLTPDTAKEMGVTGPPLRATGVDFDIRKDEPYLVYDDLDFKVCTETAGDVYARIWVRVAEIYESMYIIEQALDQMPSGPLFPENLPYDRRAPVMRVPEGEVFHRVEDPRGEMGMYMVSDGSDKPYRVKIRGPVFPTMQAMPPLIKDSQLADVVAIVGSLDPCVSEADR
ncbi:MULTISPECIES: F420H2 dehydrogenase subunit FpoD [Methanohalophilus]|uniref:F420H2 dehydrogenase subunit D n=1 Tax=Methanohalophilus euhalobius TaxID=51203 RepID=A0A285FZY3_9EURY|nr:MULTISPECIES: F420H2 dehydrogenase subunit FpoD [Methanohalophilus]RSD33869.1 MAG: NADH-quinone oxidoreductase subunit D [Methanohalophilus sp.]ODV49137.1 MAG: NADH-quinone oxidoreductase subunit D [Methanohalophilus sp. 2-GBenrich]PQV42127.1 F420H2 dehydrogenase subunit D [Methanohalophilus euhalobius]RNI12319.1 NADH-quinone oxidoreductase subunit D [Methanohalophilus euhalobius]RXG33796.1 NADH-quinone oxidoreductase subunit D [Methanohalophilus sp. WG1-DM]